MDAMCFTLESLPCKNIYIYRQRESPGCHESCSWQLLPPHTCTPSLQLPTQTTFMQASAKERTSWVHPTSSWPYQSYPTNAGNQSSASPRPPDKLLGQMVMDQSSGPSDSKGGSSFIFAMCACLCMSGTEHLFVCSIVCMFLTEIPQRTPPILSELGMMKLSWLLLLVPTFMFCFCNMVNSWDSLANSSNWGCAKCLRSTSAFTSDRHCKRWS